MARPVPGPDQVLVAVRAAGINPSEGKMRAGLTSSPRDPALSEKAQTGGRGVLCPCSAEHLRAFVASLEERARDFRRVASEPLGRDGD